jgi:hypothetical protein
MKARPSFPLSSVAVLFAVTCALAGCGRRIVVHPSRVAIENDREWTVNSVPARPAPPVASPATEK